MNKSESNFFKGIALLMMLFVHINSAKLISFMEFGGKSIWSYFYMINTPVVLFLILSGYGFFSVSQREKDNNYLFRIIKLFVHFWVILLIMLPLTKKGLDLNVITVLSNISGWHVSWNGTCWFIFPYVILALAYRKIFIWGNKVGWIKLLLFSFFIYLVAGFTVSRQSVTYDSVAPYVYNLLYLFMSQFPFVLGMCLNKYKDVVLGKRETGASFGIEEGRLVKAGRGGYF